MSKQEPRQPQQARGNSSKLYETYVDCEISLKRFLRNFLKKPEDIEELAQEAFLRTFTVELQQEIKSPKAYLFRAARNIALRELSKKTRQLTDYLEESVDDNLLGKVSSLEEELIAQQKLKQCCEAIADLPEQCRRVFLLRKVHALSHKEIAQQLGISNSTVEKHIAKGVDRFTQYMATQEPQEQSSSTSKPIKHPWS
jgi:RNA polymerase sigma-70 factor (ECF subfamily)